MHNSGTRPAQYLFSKVAQDVHKTFQDTYKVAQKLHMTPEDGLRGLQGLTKTAQDISKTAQDPPKPAQGVSKTRFFDFFEKKNRDWSYVRMFLLSVKILMKNVHTLHPHKLIQLITFALGDDWSWKGKEATRDSLDFHLYFPFYISVSQTTN